MFDIEEGWAGGGGTEGGTREGGPDKLFTAGLVFSCPFVDISIRTRFFRFSFFSPSGFGFGWVYSGLVMKHNEARLESIHSLEVLSVL